MNLSKDTIVLCLVLSVVGVAMYMKSPVAVNVEEGGSAEVIDVGAAPGPDVSFPMWFHAGLTQGDGCISTTTSTGLSDRQLENTGCIYLAAVSSGAQAAITVTLTGSSTTLINKAGACRQWFVDASRLAVATTTTFSAGTGAAIVQHATSTATGANHVIAGGRTGILVGCRDGANDRVYWTVQEFLTAANVT